MMMKQEISYKSTPEYWGGVVLCFNCAVKVAAYGYTVTPSIELEGFSKNNPCKVCVSGAKSRMADIFQMFIPEDSKAKKV